MLWKNGRINMLPRFRWSGDAERPYSSTGCSWQGSLELVHVFSVFDVISVHVFELVNVQTLRRGSGHCCPSTLKYEVQVCSGLHVWAPSPLCLSRFPFFPACQEAVAATGNRLRQILPYVMPALEEHQGQTPFLSPVALPVGICCAC